MDKTLQARFLNQLAKAPERRTVGFYQFDGELSWLTYEQLYDQARRYAAWLADHGVRQGDVCILLLASGEFSAMVLVGTLLLGAVPLLMAPPSLPGEYTNHARILNRIIRRTQARVVVTDRSMAKLRDELSPASRRTRFLFEGDAEAAVMTAGTLACAPRNTDIAALQLTSGTTGFPRICVWRQENVVAALDGMAKAMKLRDDDLCLNWTPLYHDMGLVNNFFLCLATGVPLVMLSPLDFVKKPARWLRALSDTGATVTWSPNFGFAITAQRVRADELKGIRLDKVRAFWNAAERIHFETMLAFHRQFEPYGVRFAALKTNFGCAENVGGATFSDPEGTFLVEQVDADLLYEAGVAERIECWISATQLG